MKKVLFSHSLLLYIGISAFIGYFIGCDIENDFFNLYIGKMNQLPSRYTLLLLIILVSNLVGNIFLNSAIIVREKNFRNVFLVSMKYEIYAYSLIYISLNIPVCIMNFEAVMNHLWDIFILIINAIIISVSCSTLIKFIDLKIKNKVLASCTFLIFFP